MSKNNKNDNNKNEINLDLSGKVWQQIDTILSLPSYHNIRELTVHNSSLSTIPLLPHKIEILDLSRNHIERIQGLNNLSFLRILNLSHNEIRRIEGLSKNYQLQKLYLSHNNIREIENLFQLQLLNTLDIRFNQLPHIDLLKRLEDNLNLRQLDVDGNEFAIRAHNYQIFVFQILTFLQIVDGKSIEQAMSGNNKNNYYKQIKQRKLTKRRNKSMPIKSKANKPRYMSATISNKLKNGYGDHQIRGSSTSRPSTSRPSRKSLQQIRNCTQQQPSSWTNFNHYSMKQQTINNNNINKKPSIYDYSTPKKNVIATDENMYILAQNGQNLNRSFNKLPPKTGNKPNGGIKKVRDTLLSPVSSLPEPDLDDTDSSIPAIPIMTKNNINNLTKEKQINNKLINSNKNLNNFDTKNQAKHRMKDVIKKLNEKINKLYSWHLVEIDLVSKQQMQLNEIRSELTSTKQSLSTYVHSNGSMIATPLRLLDTPASAISVDISETNTNNDGKVVNHDIGSDNLSSMTTRSALQLNNPDFVKTTLQKCYQILKRDNATPTELEAVENLVHQLESDMAANKQLQDLQKRQLLQNAEKKRGSLKMIRHETGSEHSLDVRSETNETNSMIQQFNAYNDEINKLEKELKTIDVSGQSSEVINNNNNNKIKKGTIGTMTQSFDEEDEEKNQYEKKQYEEIPSQPNSKSQENENENNIKIKLNKDDNNMINEWLSELCDELNTAKLSLKHLMDISSQETENRKAKVKEFNVVASKCDMFSSFDISTNVNKIIKTLSLNSQIIIQNYLHELQITKDSIQKLILYIIQNKSENEIQSQRDIILQRKLIDKEQYNLTLAIIQNTKMSEFKK